MRKLLPLIALLALVSLPCAATTVSRVTDDGHALEIPDVGDASVTIDGRLDEALWSRAARVELPYEGYPNDRGHARVRTECLLAFSDEALLVGFVAHDPEPERIRAHYTDRDAAFRNDVVGVTLDPFSDERHGVAFMANPFGVQMDAKVNGVGSLDAPYSLSGSSSEDFSWDAIWNSAGTITSEGYQVEMAIPWSALRFPRASGTQTWGFIAFRSWPRVNKHRFLSVRLDTTWPCYLCQAQQITGLGGMRPGRGIEITPTLTHTMSEQRDPFPRAPLETTQNTSQAGLFGRWGITPNLSLSVALNPDFSQVEADSAQLGINRRFTLFFSEKRPFFLEGANRFDSMLPVIYTRSVADPTWGIKLSGKEGRHSIGAFIARDNVTNFILPGPRSSSSASLARENDAAVMRYSYDIGTSSRLGVLFTSREGDGYENRVGGFDGFLRLSTSDEVSFQYLASRTLYPDALFDATGEELPRGRFSDQAYRVEYRHEDREWRWWGVWADRGPGFRGDAGFLTRVDERGWGAGVRRNIWAGEETWYNRIYVQADGSALDDYRGELIGDNLRVGARMDGAYQSTLSMWFIRSRDRYDGITFDQDLGQLFFNIRPTGDFTCSFNVQGGDAVDFSGNRSADVLSISPGFTLNVGRHFYMQVNHTREELEIEGDRLYRANVTQGRLVYHFGMRSLFRTIVQLTDIDRNLALYEDDVDAAERRLLSEFLFSYKVNPRTVLFLGYSNIGRSSDLVDLTTEYRTLFMKVGYAWVL